VVRVLYIITKIAAGYFPNPAVFPFPVVAADVSFIQECAIARR
jgi:hypothetical protein